MFVRGRHIGVKPPPIRRVAMPGARLQAGAQTPGTATASVQNSLSWFDDANKHRIKLASEFNFAGNSQNSSKPTSFTGGT